MEKPQTYKEFLIITVATLGGIGYVPLLQGTVASLAAVIVFWCVKNELAYFLLTVVSLILASAFSSSAEKILKRKDAPQIVIDDFSGMLLGLIFLPHTIFMGIGGFLIFRLFDSLKIYPANYFEKLKGAAGVVGDDIVAGLYTLLILNLVLFVRALF